MSREWIVECFDFRLFHDQPWAQDWRFANVGYAGIYFNIPNKLLTLTQAMNLGKKQAEKWNKVCRWDGHFRIRNVKTDDIIMVDIL